jgi:hypothetical protein
MSIEFQLSLEIVTKVMLRLNNIIISQLLSNIKVLFSRKESEATFPSEQEIVGKQT